MVPGCAVKPPEPWRLHETKTPVFETNSLRSRPTGVVDADHVVGLALVYFYLPPDSAGLPPLTTTVTFLGVLNVLTLNAASGRFSML